ncbi:MAG: hypothetical protein Q9166_007271 [cf. Caloplaca sp. 2 TL-2023]
MPSKKWQNGIRYDGDDIFIHIHESRQPRQSKWQNNARLEGPIPKSIPSHAHKLKEQLEDVYRASRGREGIPRRMVKQFSESFGELYEKLLPGKAGDSIAAQAVQERNTAQTHNKHVRRMRAFRAELPAPFDERRDVDPDLSIFVAIDDHGVVNHLRDLSASSILKKIREAMHEAHWWFMEEGFVGWVIAVRQLPAGDLELFTNTAEHRETLMEYSAWETVLLERLTQESSRYGVWLAGLGVSQLPNLQNEEAHATLIQQLLEWNKPRIRLLNHTEDIISVEVRPTNYGNPICVVNLARPEIANEIIKRGSIARPLNLSVFTVEVLTNRHGAERYWPVEARTKKPAKTSKQKSKTDQNASQSPQPPGEDTIGEDEQKVSDSSGKTSDDPGQHAVDANSTTPLMTNDILASEKSKPEPHASPSASETDKPDITEDRNQEKPAVDSIMNKEIPEPNQAEKNHSPKLLESPQAQHPDSISDTQASECDEVTAVQQQKPQSITQLGPRSPSLPPLIRRFQRHIGE